MEIGPGTGALALSVIEFLSDNNMVKRGQMEYSLVEISSTLCETIEGRFKEQYKELLQSNQIKIYNNSIFEHNVKDGQPCFVIGMEILDNMPHDRLYRDKETDPWKYQTVVSMYPSLILSIR